ncbi:MAG: purine-nucleoside phosphorylase [Bacilli bacterium]
MFLGENPIHIEAKKEEIAELVLLPGDPLRAKYIAENFLEDAKLINDVRNMLGFTGTYKGKRITVMGSGMGMPSASIYAFELIHFYGVKEIIRIGTCGAVSESALIGEIILADKVYSESNFAYTYNNYTEHVVSASKELNEKIIDTAKLSNMKIHVGMLTTMDVFGPYIDYQRVLDRIPKEYNILGEEMEAFGLIHVANSFGIKASTMATIVDSKFSNIVLSSEEREKNLNDMITLALDSI